MRYLKKDRLGSCPPVELVAVGSDAWDAAFSWSNVGGSEGVPLCFEQ